MRLRDRFPLTYKGTSIQLFNIHSRGPWRVVHQLNHAAVAAAAANAEAEYVLKKTENRILLHVSEKDHSTSEGSSSAVSRPTCANKYTHCTHFA